MQCAMIIVRACTVIMGHAYNTTIIVYACTMIIEHVSCPPRLMFDEIDGRVSGGRSPPEKQRKLAGPETFKKTMYGPVNDPVVEIKDNMILPNHKYHPVILCLRTAMLTVIHSKLQPQN